MKYLKFYKEFNFLGFKQNRGTSSLVFVFYQLIEERAGTLLKVEWNQSNKQPMKDILFWLAAVWDFFYFVWAKKPNISKQRKGF